MRNTQPAVEVKRYTDRELHYSDMGQNIATSNVFFVGRVNDASKCAPTHIPICAGVVGVCAVIAMVGTIIAGVAYYKYGHSVHTHTHTKCVSG